MALMKKHTEQARQQAVNNQESPSPMRKIQKHVSKEESTSKEVITSNDVTTSSGKLNIFGDIKSFEEAQIMAKVLSTSDFTPVIFRGNISNCLLALEISTYHTGSVFTIMQNMRLVENEFAWSATYIIACINSSNRFKSSLMYEIQKDKDEKIIACTAYVIDKLGNKIEGPKVTIEMVNDEGWINNSKWKNIPELMFRYRSASFFGKTNTPDLFMGMHTIEEIEDKLSVYKSTDELSQEPQQEVVSIQEPQQVIEEEPTPVTSEDKKPLVQTQENPLNNTNQISEDKKIDIEVADNKNKSLKPNSTSTKVLTATHIQSEIEVGNVEVINDENDFEEPAYMQEPEEEPIQAVQQEDRPIIENLSDFKDYIDSLDLQVVIKKGNGTSKEYFAAVNVEQGHPYAEELIAADFKFIMGRYIKKITSLVDPSDIDELEAEEMFA